MGLSKRLAPGSRKETATQSTPFPTKEDPLQSSPGMLTWGSPGPTTCTPRDRQGPEHRADYGSPGDSRGLQAQWGPAPRGPAMGQLSILAGPLALSYPSWFPGLSSRLSDSYIPGAPRGRRPAGARQTAQCQADAAPPPAHSVLSLGPLLSIVGCVSPSPLLPQKSRSGSPRQSGLPCSWHMGANTVHVCMCVCVHVQVCCVCLRV